MLKRTLALSSCLAFSFAALDAIAAPPAAPAMSPSKTAGAADSPIDPCTLLTNEAIGRAMGETVKETKMERSAEEGFVISQCLYLFPTDTNAVTLRLVQRGEGEDARDPRQVWQETLSRDLVEKAMERRKKGPPQRVPNLGDEAFFIGGRKTGGLYVLKGNRHFRLGLGGEPNQERKIEKATQLARLILKKL